MRLVFIGVVVSVASWLLLAACDSTSGPDGSEVIVLVVAEPEVARVGVDTVFISQTVRNLGSDPVVVTSMTSGIRILPSGEHVGTHLRQSGRLEIAGRDSLNLGTYSRVFAAGTYVAYLSLDNLGVIGRDTFEYVQ